MPQVHDIGTKTYTHAMRYPTRKFPIFDTGGYTQEIEHPFRTGKALVLRIPFSTYAVVLGRWGETKPEEQALTDAIGARRLDDFHVE
jgi:hypothetical protein